MVGRTAEQVCRWSCSCTASQATHWLNLAAEHALAAGDDAFGEAVGAVRELEHEVRL